MNIEEKCAKVVSYDSFLLQKLSQEELASIEIAELSSTNRMNVLQELLRRRRKNGDKRLDFWDVYFHNLRMIQAGKWAL